MMYTSYDSADMVKVGSAQAVQEGPPGAFFIEDVERGGTVWRRMWARLPHDFVGALTLSPAPPEEPGVWEWNGDAERPTISRELHFRGRWRGKIENGRMICLETKPEPGPTRRRDSRRRWPMPTQTVKAAVKKATKKRARK